MVSHGGPRLISDCVNRSIESDTACFWSRQPGNDPDSCTCGLPAAPIDIPCASTHGFAVAAHGFALRPCRVWSVLSCTLSVRYIQSVAPVTSSDALVTSSFLLLLVRHLLLQSVAPKSRQPCGSGCHEMLNAGTSKGSSRRASLSECVWVTRCVCKWNKV